MNEISNPLAAEFEPIDPAKFKNPDLTALGEARASVALSALETLWINTGTLCNITCANCYIESARRMTGWSISICADAVSLFDEIATLKLGTREIGFTGGEPFMNPDMLAMMEAALARGHDVLVLTNAMQPMQRLKIKTGLVDLNERFPGRITLRVSLDHYTKALHEAERGPDTWDKAVAGIDWLQRSRLPDRHRRAHLLGRDDDDIRTGYGDLIAVRGWPIDPADRDSWCCFRKWTRRPMCLKSPPRAGIFSAKRPRRHDVRDKPHGGQTQRGGRARRAAVHAAALRWRLRNGADLAATLKRRRRQVPTGRSSSTTRTAPSSACWVGRVARGEWV